MTMTYPEWIPYTPAPERPEVKLCYHNGTPDSDLPLRNVLYGSTEPNYETATYNYCAKCIQRHLRAAVNAGLSYILFATQCKREGSAYAGRFFIVGYYEIGWTTTMEDARTAIRAKKFAFTSIEDAYEITPERWERIRPGGKALRSVRQLSQRIPVPLADEIVNHLDAHDATADYLREVARLKAQYNPYDTIPPGRIFIINVGANSKDPQQSPLFEDGTFEFVPIPGDYEEGLTYADVPQFYYPNKPLLDPFGTPAVSPSDRVHNDPEFATFTYGDKIRKGALRQLKQGDFLFYLARLVPYDEQHFDTDGAIFALIGYIEIEERRDAPHDPMFTSPAFNRNAHVRRWENDAASFDDFVVFKGSTDSRRFRYAVPFDREFVEHIPILTAKNNAWNWDGTKELRVIGSHTRTPRSHINPTTEPERAERFWTRIRESQQWS